MVSLTSFEQVVYNDKFVQRAPNLSPGVYYIRDLFEENPSVPRIARRFYEEVSAGRFDNIRLNGKLSSDGYLVFERKQIHHELLHETK